MTQTPSNNETKIRNESNKFTMQRKDSSRLDANAAPNRMIKRKATAAPQMAQQEAKRPAVFAPHAFREQSVVDSGSNQASTHSRKAQAAQSNYQACSNMHHGSSELRGVDNERSMSHFDASTLRTASEDNMLHTGENQGREVRDDSDNYDQDDEDDAEYERVSPFRHALMQHLTSSHSNPYSFNQLANNPTLLVDLIQSFLEQNSKVVYDCFMADNEANKPAEKSAQ
ncbi:hypothetical protein LTR22_019569 [Elasticomyces elasticus]|nr:hypothetical protein LTR22_019569 [Elasticomyces elasticus]KAK4911362.1 hypothetical protein LTR49_020101 [Elasticomyces elasticus]KAK5751628.1 hypothetical protein LTS12_018333 [Elasticomyces elasticus]